MRDPKLNLPESELPRYVEEEDFRSSMHWKIFRIMAELMDGWQFLADFKNNVAVFGSASINKEHQWYKEAVKLGTLIANEGYAVVTGGGPGIMEAANFGAAQATSANKGESLGIDIKTGEFTRANPYVKKGVSFHYFFTRSLMISYSSRAYVYFPGGIGTLDHLSSIITLIQTGKTAKSTPIILVSSEFWGSIDRWVQRVMFEKFKAIDEEDMKLYHIVDTAEEAMEIIRKAPPRDEF
jgi:uncharacterized protein (TIGR00730 family)